LPADLARFRRLTMGHCLIMGHKTYESLGGRSLPGRRISALSRSIHPEIIASGSLTARSLDEAIGLAREQLQESEAFIAGGAQVYAEALNRDLVDRMYLTRVDVTLPTDVSFPAFDSTQWELVEETQRPADSDNAFSLTFQTLARKPR
jgi:dihydrofolate reductase